MPIVTPPTLQVWIDKASDIHGGQFGLPPYSPRSHFLDDSPDRRATDAQTESH